jgi:hypothetical protein
MSVKGMVHVVMLLGLATSAGCVTGHDSGYEFATRYIAIYPGQQCSNGRNAEARNSHSSRRVQATFQYADGQTSVRTFAPGETMTVGCTYGAVRVTNEVAL